MSQTATALDLTVEPLNDEIRASYALLLPHQVTDGFAFLDWKFDRTQSGPGLFSVARREGEIIGLSAYLRLTFKLGNARGLSYQAIDSIVSPAAQGQGVFTKLARSFSEKMAEKTDLIWGFPNANAAPAWFGKLGWRRHGYAPFLFKPLRTGYFLSRIGLPLDLRVTTLRDGGASAISEVDDRVDELWMQFSRSLVASVDRGRDYLNWRLFQSPGRRYRVVHEDGPNGGALVASTVSDKHGGSIGYIMEVLGCGRWAADLLRSEVGRMADAGAEVALAWCYPWSPNYEAYRKAGFLPFPERLRPVEIHVGSRAYSTSAVVTEDTRAWYLSYLDSDTN